MTKKKILFYVAALLIIFLVIFLTLTYEKPSLMNEYSKLEGADPTSYQELVHGYGWGYVKDKDNVYAYLGNQKEGYKFIKLPEADSNSFHVVYLNYGVDDNHVYWGWEIVEQADPSSFEVYYFPANKSEFRYAKDVSHFYDSGDIVNADTEEAFVDMYFIEPNMDTYELIK